MRFDKNVEKDLEISFKMFSDAIKKRNVNVFSHFVL